jgi:hypothetical protein
VDFPERGVFFEGEVAHEAVLRAYLDGVHRVRWVVVQGREERRFVVEAVRVERGDERGFGDVLEQPGDDFAVVRD